jgi:hypothetical protein
MLQRNGWVDVIAVFSTSDRILPRSPVLMIARFSLVRGSLLESEFAAV